MIKKEKVFRLEKGFKGERDFQVFSAIYFYDVLVLYRQSMDMF